MGIMLSIPHEINILNSLYVQIGTEMISVNSYIEISPIFHMDVSLPIDVDSPVLFPSSTCKTLLGSSVVSFAKVSIIINVMKTFRLRISTDVWGYNICYLEMAKQFLY